MNKRYSLIVTLILVVLALLSVTPGAATPTRSSSAIWTSQSSGTTNSLNSVHFINAAEGWVAGRQATLLHTTNGGNTWLPVTNTGVDPSRGFNSVRFIDQNVGWVGGSRSIRRTLDGGVTWRGAQYPSNTADSRYAMFPVSSTTVWQVGMQNYCNPCFPAHIRYTLSTDGNASSTYAQYLISHEFHAISGVSFIDQDTGWSVGASVFITTSLIAQITNASTSANIVVRASNITEKLRNIQMLDANTGWVIGDGGVILKTTNGWSTWSPQTSGTTANLNGMHFVDANNGWVVGDGGTILRTTNGGETWTPEVIGITEDLAGVFFLDATKGYAVGANGTILIRSIEAHTYMPLIGREAP